MSLTHIDHLSHPSAILVEQDTREGIIARRNILLGLWAAARLGLEGAEAEAYAWSVHFADLEAPGHDDVIAKIAADLTTHGASVCERSLRRHLREMQKRAELQLASNLT
ncbi:DUF1476 domain-containing protein [Methylobacterium isbiliense]|uniref:DUF1476 domain-containing protein n=1 Tax=Methylobacterium isbiliense TaxID=315478 RepID=A0ABQ4SBQ7_9HYPH|nr:DUF1476 domain-containing protein [Methylobacterium isbiliense]MDN3626629.1 DUF1476 domain-containing protein [Methylobacterium isbiliense]GJD99269.1 hypothetical protein GMJLKIPL_1185 [Methylobacterium isbiliense]